MSQNATPATEFAPCNTLRSADNKIRSNTTRRKCSFQYYFVLHSLHKSLPSTTSYYKACTKYVPVLLRTTKLAQSTSQYYFVLQSLHKVLPSTTWYHKTCSFKIDVFLQVFLRSDLKTDVSCEASSIFITCHKMPRLPRNLHLVTLCAALTMRLAATRHVESAAPATKNAEGYLQNAALATTK